MMINLLSSFLFGLFPLEAILSLEGSNVNSDVKYCFIRVCLYASINVCVGNDNACATDNTVTDFHGDKHGEFEE